MCLVTNRHSSIEANTEAAINAANNRPNTMPRLSRYNRSVPIAQEADFRRPSYFVRLCTKQSIVFKYNFCLVSYCQVATVKWLKKAKIWIKL